MKEKVEVQRQAEKENADLFKQVKLLEAELEEQVNRVIELEQAQRTESGDLQQQIQALEKQLEKNRRFLDVSGIDNCYLILQKCLKIYIQICFKTSIFLINNYLSVFLHCVFILVSRNKPWTGNTRGTSSSRRSINWSNS